MRLLPSIALLRTQSDDRLVDLAAAGYEPAFTALVERHRRVVLRACRRILPEARAEDATQQAFLAAWRAINRGDEVRDVRPWLLRIARNTALNALRVQGYDYDELRESLRVAEAPQAELERRDVVRQTLAGLAGLPERQREALLLSAVQGVSHAEIARDLGLSEGAARQLVLRARTALRSAATALTPAPVMTWVASAAARGGSPGIAEVAVGATGAGAGALIAKAGTVAVLAAGAVAGPGVVDRDSREPVAVAKPRPVAEAAREAEKPAATAQPGEDRAVEAEADAPGGSADGERRQRGRGRGGATGGDDDDRSGSNRGSGEEREPDDDEDDRSGSNSGPSESEEEEEDRPETDDDEDRSGSDSGSDDEDAPAPTATVEEDNSGSGSDSDSSGSGSTRSGSDDEIDEIDDH